MDNLTVIEEDNLSLAWARIFMLLSQRTGKEIAPLVVSISGFGNGEPQEDKSLRHALDACLAKNGSQSIQTVANTIFPQSIWRISNNDREELYKIYLENLPSYVEMEPNKNRCGLYFARLIAFNTDPRTGKPISGHNAEREPVDGNQLEFIIAQCRPGVRRSMFQASIFDPGRDHTRAAQLGFPCLQHVSFIPDFSAKTLMLNAFYATQQALEKAYGNYLGLYRLGAFVAHATNLTLNRMTCFVGIEKMDERPPKDEPTWLRLKESANSLVASADARVSRRS